MSTVYFRNRFWKRVSSRLKFDHFLNTHSFIVEHFQVNLFSASSIFWLLSFHGECLRVCDCARQTLTDLHFFVQPLSFAQPDSGDNDQNESNNRCDNYDENSFVQTKDFVISTGLFIVWKSFNIIYNEFLPILTHDLAV